MPRVSNSYTLPVVSLTDHSSAVSPVGVPGCRTAGAATRGCCCCRCWPVVLLLQPLLLELLAALLLALLLLLLPLPLCLLALPSGPQPGCHPAP